MADFATGPGRKLIELLRRANDGLAFQGTVYAFEAHPDMIESLWRNFDGSGLADQVKLVPFLVHTHEI